VCREPNPPRVPFGRTRAPEACAQVAYTARHAVHLTCAGRTDVGVVRLRNEDALLLLPGAGVFAVADGVGGRGSGNVASALAVDLIGSALSDAARLPAGIALRALRASLVHAGRVVYERGRADDRDAPGMGTTATVLLISDGRYLIGHVGDSRAYLWRGNRIQQITRDHTFIQDLLDAGHLTLTQAKHHPYRRVITRCLGDAEASVPDLYDGSLQRRDVYLLVSDGVTEMLRHDLLTEIVRATTSPGELVDHLVCEANRLGGLDNATAVAVRIDRVDRG